MFIFTKSRQLLDFNQPHHYNYTLREIGECLNKIVRFAGHRDVTVLAHTMWMYRQACGCGLSPQSKLAVLLHDAPEAFTGDITAPVQQLLGDEGRANLHAVQERLMTHIIHACLNIFDHARIWNPTTQAHVKHLDAMALWNEALVHEDVPADLTVNDWLDSIEYELNALKEI